MDNCTFINADFFKLTGSYDLVYDYTFLCAIPPHWRADWSSQMAALIVPGGVLVTLIFPIVPGMEGGPPFEMSVELVSSLLLDNFELISMEKPHASHPGREGKEMIALWRRKPKPTPTL